MGGEIKIDPSSATGSEITLEGEDLENLRLWKPRAGEAVTVTAGLRLLRARVLELGGTRARLLIFEEMGVVKSPRVEITLLQALPGKERMELIIEKTTELGVDHIIPFSSMRSITLEERDSAQRKSHRWEDRALKAARQSRRSTIPGILPYRTFGEALDASRGLGLKVFLWEGRELPHLREVLSGLRGGEISSAGVMSGPEGGFDPGEAREAVEAGFTPVTLGTNMLRAETASIAALSILRYELGG